MNDDLENVCIEAILACHSPWGTDRGYENFSQNSRCPDEIQTEHLTDTSRERYLYDNQLVAI
jgi:hypothetical protein